MRELKVVGLDADGKFILCEGAGPNDKFKLPADDRLRAFIDRGPRKTPAPNSPVRCGRDFKAGAVPKL